MSKFKCTQAVQWRSKSFPVLHLCMAKSTILFLQEDLKEKVKSLQSIKAELDMRHAQVDDYKFNIKQMQVSGSNQGADIDCNSPTHCQTKY